MGTGSKPKDVRGIFAALSGIASSEVAKNGKFVVPHVCMLKLKHKAATPAGKRMMFGKEVKVAAMKASKRVKAFPAKALKTAIRGARHRFGYAKPLAPVRGEPHARP